MTAAIASARTGRSQLGGVAAVTRRKDGTGQRKGQWRNGVDFSRGSF
jgi:hypothetical protein